MRLTTLVILKSNPLDDISHASDLDTIVKNGVLYQADAFGLNFR